MVRLGMKIVEQDGHVRPMLSLAAGTPSGSTESSIVDFLLGMVRELGLIAAVRPDANPLPYKY